jgi:chromosome segregation ATPase
MQEERWAGAESQISELEAQLALKVKLEEQITEQAERLASLSTAMSSSNENGAAASAMIAQLEAELTTKRSKIEALEEESSLQEQRSEQGVRAITLLERELDEKRDLLTSLNAELTALRETGAANFIGLSDPSAFTEAVSMRATLLA